MKTLKLTDEEYKKVKDILKVEVAKDKDIKELSDLVGQTYTFWCVRYIYHGTVEKVNATFVTLKDAAIVYDTGELNASSASDMQALPKGVQIIWSAVESFMEMKW